LISVGYGTYKFFDTRSPGTQYEDEIMLADLGFRGSYNFKVKDYKLELIGGAGLSRKFGSSYTYQGENIDSGQAMSPFPYFILGIGLGF